MNAIKHPKLITISYFDALIRDAETTRFRNTMLPNNFHFIDEEI